MDEQPNQAPQQPTPSVTEQPIPPAPIPQADPTQPQAIPPTTPIPTPTPSKSKKGLVIAGIILVIISIAVAAFLILGKKTPTPNSDSNITTAGNGQNNADPAAVKKIDTFVEVLKDMTGKYSDYEAGFKEILASKGVQEGSKDPEHAKISLEMGISSGLISAYIKKNAPEKIATKVGTVNSKQTVTAYYKYSRPTSQKNPVGWFEVGAQKNGNEWKLSEFKAHDSDPTATSPTTN